MQGRIQAILGMRPPQLLSLLQETAGTSLYELNRKEAVRTFDVKQAKLEAIERTIRDEIAPKIARLERERRLGVEIALCARAIGILEIAGEFERVRGLQRLSVRLSDELSALRQRETLQKSDLQGLENRFIALNAQAAERRGDAFEAPDELSALHQLENALALAAQRLDFEREKLQNVEKQARQAARALEMAAKQAQEASAQLASLEASGPALEIANLREILAAAEAQKARLDGEAAVLRSGELDAGFLAQFRGDLS